MIRDGCDAIQGVPAQRYAWPRRHVTAAEARKEGWNVPYKALQII
jgi:hypothetical protein